MRTALLALFLCVWVVNVAVWDVEAATPPVPTISPAISGPGPMYPNPPVSVVPTAAMVEDFPYVTEEYFVSGTAKDAPYTTRIIVRRPKDPNTFSGVVVSEALHAGGRSLVFEWSRVSILVSASSSKHRAASRPCLASVTAVSPAAAAMASNASHACA